MKSLFVNPEDQSILRTERNIQKYSNLFCMHSYIGIMQFKTRTVKNKNKRNRFFKKKRVCYGNGNYGTNVDLKSEGCP